MKLKCQHDGYEWDYKGQKTEGYTNCPKCFYKVNIIKNTLLDRIERDVGK